MEAKVLAHPVVERELRADSGIDLMPNEWLLEPKCTQKWRSFVAWKKDGASS